MWNKKRKPYCCFIANAKQLNYRSTVWFIFDHLKHNKKNHCLFLNTEPWKINKFPGIFFHQCNDIFERYAILYNNIYCQQNEKNHCEHWLNTIRTQFDRIPDSIYCLNTQIIVQIQLETQKTHGIICKSTNRCLKIVKYWIKIQIFHEQMPTTYYSQQQSQQKIHYIYFVKSHYDWLIDIQRVNILDVWLNITQL